MEREQVPSRTRVCMLAANNVRRDNRILKEADSLARLGYEVTIVGVSEGERESFERDSGVMVLLVPLRMVLARQKRAVLMWLKLACEAGLLVMGFVGVMASSFVLLSLPFFQGKSVAFVVSFWTALGAVALIAIRRRIPQKAITAIKSVYGPVDTAIGATTDNRPIYSRVKRYFQAFVTVVYRAMALSEMRRFLTSSAVDTSPEVVHCHDLATLPAGAQVAKQTGARVVFDAHEIYEDVAQGTGLQKWVSRMLLRRYQDKVDAFITINDSIGEFYATNYPELPPAAIVKNATLFTGSAEYDGRLHRAAGIEPDQNILLYQGGFAEKRGLRALVHAARHLSERWTLVMMGWGRLENELKELGDSVNFETSDNRTAPAVCFIPPAPAEDLQNWTSGARIGVIPYENVGLNHLYCTPNKLWEYPNARVPILCTDLVELHRVVAAHDIGWLFPGDFDSRHIAELVNALDDDEIATKRAACAHFIKRDNWSTYEEVLRNLYTGLESPGNSPAPTSDLVSG